MNEIMAKRKEVMRNISDYYQRMPGMNATEIIKEIPDRINEIIEYVQMLEVENNKLKSNLMNA